MQLSPAHAPGPDGEVIGLEYVRNPVFISVQ